MAKQTYRYTGPVSGINLGDNNEMRLSPGQNIELSNTDIVKYLILQNLLIPLTEQSKK